MSTSSTPPTSDPGSWSNWFRGLFERPPLQDLSTQDIANRVYKRRWRTWSAVIVMLLVAIVVLYVKALYNQSDVIAVFEEDIVSAKPEIMMQAYMLGPLLSPQRVALLCEYPMMYSWLGYTSPYTGPVIKALVQLDPPILVVVEALTLLESGLVVDPSKTSPPTIYNEVLRWVYQQETYTPPQVVKPPSVPKQAESVFNQIAPWAMQLAMIIPMIL